MGSKATIKKAEKKTKTISLRLQPSTYDTACISARVAKLPTSEWISRAIKQQATDEQGNPPRKREIEMKLYTVAELAEILHLSTKTITRYIYSGKLQGVKIGNKLQVTEQALKMFVDGAQVQPAK